MILLLRMLKFNGTDYRLLLCSYYKNIYFVLGNL